MLIDALPPERDDAVTIRAIAGGEVEHIRVPSWTVADAYRGSLSNARPDMPRLKRPPATNDERQVPNIPRTWNAEQPGSRFTARASLAILTRPDGASRYAEGEDAGPTDEVIADALGGPPSAIQALGEARGVDASYGRGAAGWVPVVEWTMQAIVGGILGNAAWNGIKHGAQELRELTERLRERQVDFLVSRGTAALLAIDHLLRSGEETQILDVEAVEEPSALNGDPPSELNFVGIEPWLVSLINAGRTTRYVVAISPSGQIGGVLRLPVGEEERHYLRIPHRDEADESEGLVAEFLDATPDDGKLHQALDGDDFDETSPREDVEFGLQEIFDGARAVERGIRQGIKRRIRRGRAT